MSHPVTTVAGLLRVIERTENRIRSDGAKVRKLVEELQEKCSHPVEQVREAPTRISEFFGVTARPFRVCLICGLAEEGWYCGYDQLSLGHSEGKLMGMSRDEAQRHVRTFLTQEKMSERRAARRKVA